MADGKCAAASSSDAGVIQAFSNLEIAEGERGESSTREKDPRKIARRYQLELCRKALEENVIVYLGTGCGKTHIAVLLIYELGHLIRKPQKDICVFLAPAVHLVQQQARVIEESVDFRVGVYCGNSQSLNSHRDWGKEIEKYEKFAYILCDCYPNLLALSKLGFQINWSPSKKEVLVMTPQILLHTLCHRFIKMELIALLIFDECHHAQLESNHPYAEIMKVFYRTDLIKLPRIFGMTASPKLGKGATITGLETLLHAKVYTVEDMEELENFVTTKVKVYQYDSTSCFHTAYCMKLEEIKQQCLSMLGTKTDDHSILQSIKKALSRLHQNLMFCLESLGLFGALQACHILSSGSLIERIELIEDEGHLSGSSVCDEYLVQGASFLASSCSRDGSGLNLLCAKVSKEPFFSKKLLCLVGILSNFGLRPNMKCIVFVNRIVIARSLSKILQNLESLSWKCDCLVGVHSGVKSMSRKSMDVILKKFHSGELNLLVATKVGEEGLDIQTCCLVVRFDLPETISSFIQSRGRARMPQSEYAFVVNSGSQLELNMIKSFKEAEDQMNEEIALRSPSELFVDFNERTYKVDSTLATISSGSSISLLHHYCSKLPHDEYFNPNPQFFYFDDTDGTVCHIILPSNAPIHQIVSTPQSSRKSAKRSACLKACEELHKIGALTSYLLPDGDPGSADREELMLGSSGTDKEELMLDTAGSDDCEDDESRGALHEMLIPAALKEPWTELSNPVHLNSYFIKFNPVPKDRLYMKFGLFLKALLPGEAERMEADLHLAHGRSVMTELVPSGLVEFHNDEIQQGLDFQEMFLKIVLDRKEFIPEYVPLGKSDLCKSGALTFYLLLPVVLAEYGNTIAVDWETVRRCLSSPIFRIPAHVVDNEIPPQSNCLQLKNGLKSINDIKNSLVYAPYKGTFFFISTILHEKNGYSLFNDSESHVEHLNKKFGIQLSYPKQPLLQAKQLFRLRNLLHDRKQQNSETHELEEWFFEIPPELCELKIIGFSKDIGSSLSLLPSIMHRLESLLVAIELKDRLSASFPEGAEVAAHRVLEALTTERCNERLSLERLEVLGDAFLKFAVARHLFLQHNALDEGQLTRKRSDLVNNTSLFKLAIMHNIQVYIRDQSLDPSQFFVLGHPCPRICNEETEATIHSEQETYAAHDTNAAEVRCSKSHHWLHKKTISDVIEALVGAFIVDSGFKAASAFLRWIGIQVNFEAWQVIDVCTASSRFMPLLTSIDIAALEMSLGYQFLHKGLVLEAFLHPSFNKIEGGCYQRLEFLGDAILDYLITSYLYSVYPRLKPGQLTDLRSMYVNNTAFANIAVSRSFDRFIMCDSSGLCEAIKKYADFIRTPVSEMVLPEGPKLPKALGDLVESSIGAILIDTGFDLNAVWKIMLSFLDPTAGFCNQQFNPIRKLQEFRQHHKWELQFSEYKEGKFFVVEAKVVGEDICSSACATNLNKTDAKRMAAEKLCEKLKAKGYEVKSKLLELEEVLKSNNKLEAKLIGYDETPVDTRVPAVIETEHAKMPKPFSRIRPLGKSSSLFEKGGLLRGTAKSRLYEFCAANDWKPPLFDCCKEEGPSHLTLFTFKVVLVIEEVPEIVECFGAPRGKKNAAAEHAAEGALWYLKQMGYLPTPK